MRHEFPVYHAHTASHTANQGPGSCGGSYLTHGNPHFCTMEVLRVGGKMEIPFLLKHSASLSAYCVILWLVSGWVVGQLVVFLRQNFIV